MGPGKGNAMGPDFWRELPLAVANWKLMTVYVR